MTPSALTGSGTPYWSQLEDRRLEVIATAAPSVRWQMVFTVVVVSALVWTYVPEHWVVLWACCALLVRERRIAALRRLVHARTEPAVHRVRWVIAWNAVMGASQGSASLFMVWLPPDRDAILTMILVSLAAGAVSTSSTIPRAFAAYAGLVLVPVATMWLLAGTALTVGIGVLALMFFDVQYRFAKNNAETFAESFRMRFENEELARRLAGESAALLEARDRAEAANRSKSRFLAAASHDLRQPLHALSLYSSALKLTPKDPQVAEISQQIAVSIDALRALLDGLLDISKLDAGVVTPAPHDVQLASLVGRLVQEFKRVAEQRGIEMNWVVADNLVVRTDPVLFQRVLRNVLDNALKYTRVGNVLINAITAGERVEVSVRDTGVGIAGVEQERVFEEFYQVDNPERDRTKGLGLGLAIVRRLARILDIDVSLESEVGVGTTVRVLLQGSIAVTRSPKQLPELAPPFRGVKVLVIDDEAAVRRGMTTLLERFGCQVAVAGDTQAAVDRARQDRPDIVLTDYRLRNNENGIDAFMAIRAEHPGMPAVLISGDTAPERLQEAERSGIRLLHKPVDGERLRETIAAALRA